MNFVFTGVEIPETLVPGDKIIIDITEMPNPPSSKPLSGFSLAVLKIEGTECTLNLLQLCEVEKSKPFTSNEGLVVKEPYPVAISNNDSNKYSDSGFEIKAGKNNISFKKSSYYLTIRT